METKRESEKKKHRKTVRNGQRGRQQEERSTARERGRKRKKETDMRESERKRTDFRSTVLMWLFVL